MEDLVAAEAQRVASGRRRDRTQDASVVERVEHPGETLGRKAFDRDAANEQVAETRRIAGPHLSAAQHSIEVGRAWRDVQGDTLSCQSEMEVVYELIAEVFPAIVVGDRKAAHPTQLHSVSDRVFQIR